MPNHCFNVLTSSRLETIKDIISNYITYDEKDHECNIFDSEKFDFEKIEPISETDKDSEKAYHERLLKWGTKWDGYWVSVGEDEDYFIYFYTAWSPPIPIVRKLAELYKNTAFTLEYREIGCGFCGKATAKWEEKENKVNLEDNSWDITEDELVKEDAE
jgi:hypothetical protein